MCELSLDVYDRHMCDERYLDRLTSTLRYLDNELERDGADVCHSVSRRRTGPSEALRRRSVRTGGSRTFRYP